MASIYTNLRTERQYWASTGLSEQTFNQLFEQFKSFVCLKKAIPPAHMNPYFKMPEKHYFSFYFITLLQNLSDLTDTRLTVWVFR
jgi:hypothetical protein